MQEAIDDLIARRRLDPGGLGRLLSISLAAHLTVVVLAVVVPRAWLVRETPKPMVMTLSLGGSPAERSGGMVAAGARPVEQVAPPPRRPEPIPPATPKPSTVIAVPKSPVKPPAKMKEPGPPSPAVTRTPTTGAQLTRGTSVADTGATGQGTGLTFGGGAGGAVATLESDFCCKDYLDELVRRINQKWNKVQPESGSVTVMFEIRRDGTFADPVLEQSSGSVLLDVASRSVFKGLTLPPLPREYAGDRLRIHLTFPYVR